MIPAAFVFAAMTFLAPLWIPPFNLGWPVFTGLVPVLARTIGFASACSLAIVVGGFLTATALPMNSVWLRLWMPLAVLPSLLGDGTASYLFRNLPLFVPSAQSRPQWLFLLLLLLVATWQGLALCSFVFWLRISSLPSGLYEFMKASGFSRGEEIRWGVWPHCREVAVVLVLFVFGSAVQEGLRVSTIFHSSTGTGTEFVNHYLARVLQEDRGLGDYSFAVSRLATLGRVTFGFALFAALIVAWIVRKSGGKSSLQLNAVLAIADPAGKEANARYAFATLLFFFVPTFVPFTQLELGAPLLRGQTWLVSMSSFGLACGGALAVCLTAIVLSFWLRIRFPRYTVCFEGPITIMIAALLSLRFMSGTALAYLILQWTSVLSFVGGPVVPWLLWLGLIVILTLPFIALFLIVSHFEVPTSELDFLEVSEVRLHELWRIAFWKRLRGAYLLSFIFGISLVWSDTIVAGIFSTYQIPSASYEISKRVTGRGSDHAEAAALILPIALLAAVGLMLYGRRLNSIMARQHDPRQN